MGFSIFCGWSGWSTKGVAGQGLQKREYFPNIDYVVDLQDDKKVAIAKALATAQYYAVHKKKVEIKQLVLFRIFWILLMLNIISLSCFYGGHERFY